MNGKLAIANIAAAGAVAIALCTPAAAADLARRTYAKELPPLMMQPLYNWTGFYVGANFGGAFSSENVTAGNGATFSTDPSGVLGGVQLGYNYQFSPSWLLGVEGELAWTSAEGNTNFNNPPGPTLTLTSNHHWYDTLDGRLGYVMGPWLLYAKGGGAWMNASYRLAANSGIAGAASISSTRGGWNAGAGVEYMFGERWSAKLEYDYLDFGTSTLGFGVPLGAGVAIKTRVNEVKAGVNYHWAPGTLFGMF
jgi:outer membrane autotransporter protein